MKAFPLRGDACRWQAFIAARVKDETGGPLAVDEVEMNKTNNSKLTGDAMCGDEGYFVEGCLPMCYNLN